MKTLASEKTSTYPGIYGPVSKITKHRRDDVENEEMQSYLSRLIDLVPYMPRNRKVTKLEIIQLAIDYICDLQTALEMNPDIDAAAVQSAAAVMLCSNAQESAEANLPLVTPLHRQPLGVLPPNANVAVNSNFSPDSSLVSSSRQSEKVSSTKDSKTFSY